jgi:hypothetical protein
VIKKNRVRIVPNLPAWVKSLGRDAVNDCEKKGPRITRMTRINALFIRVFCVIRGPNLLFRDLFRSR